MDGIPGFRARTVSPGKSSPFAALLLQHLTGPAPVLTPTSEKPFTDLEAEPSVFPPKPFQTSPPRSPPRENLDARSLGHLRKLIWQTLKEVYVDLDAWEKVITDVALEIAQDIPFVMEILGRHVSTGVTAEDGRPPLHHVIKVVTDPDGEPSDSHYVPGPGENGISAEEREAEPRWMEVGGTVILKGNKNDLLKLERVMELIVFVVCNLKLEMYLFRDHFAVRPDKNDAHALQHKQNQHDSHPIAPTPLRKAGRSIWSWLKGDHGGNGTSGGGKNSVGVESGGESLDSSNRFERVIQQIQKTIISASPDVYFPPPHLLVRLRDEEISLHSPRPPDKDDRRVSYFAEDVEFHGVPGRGGTPKLKGMVGVYSALRAEEAVKSNVSRSNKISVDSKAGLGYLMTNNNSINGVMKHQSISFAYSYYHRSSNIPCRPPEIVTVEYYQKCGDNHQDRTLGEYIELLCNTASGLCPDTACGRYMSGHAITYTHGHGRISVTMEETPSSAGLPPDDDWNLHAWMSCRHCEYCSPVTPISDGTWHYSFAKYLELIYYNPTFIPSSACSHIRENQSVARRCFRLRNRCVIFAYDDIDLFEMRVPKIQVSPDHHLMSPQEELDQDSMYGPHPFGLDGEAILDAAKMEITYFYGSAMDHVLVLGLATGSSLVAQNEGTKDQVRAQLFLDDVTKNLKEEEAWLYDELKAGKVGGVNNVRRRLMDRVKEVTGMLDDWKKTHAVGCQVQPQWQIPEYCRPPSGGAWPKCHVFPNSFVTVREDEPTSIIAFTLSSKDYINQVKKLRAESQKAGASSTSSTSPPTVKFALPPGSAGSPPSTQPQLPQQQTSSDWVTVEGDHQTKVKIFSHDPSPGAPKQHIKYKFREGKTSYYCTVYYADQFDQLRRKCSMGGMYVRSLSRCTAWDASGGKSKATFFKTHDDQLVVKQLAAKWTIAEKDALLKFAPAYFEYMNNSDKHPTILAKIFGFYTIKHKNLHTGQVMKLDVLVMEHLFANITISRKFDLKGMPDRHMIPRKDKNSDVMWDGEWEDGRYKQLLRLHAHSKKIIQESVYNDTQFLCEANVMDYSLLVGVCDEKKELVVGIVDFIGPYTWYKKLESRGKTTLAPLRGGKDPTVLPPDRYRDRFRNAMDQNFLMVPDKWIKIPGQETTLRKLPPVL
ncbi:1-phosphatidylinositol-3-phosphate 5-kinase [Borealophlyctis nickersoniae]|nr:1-phosphatidylinositol-3-phosphate 5-kinase [Borealophlyctis nickersoniae]